jgi:hypothetical protein
MGRKKDRKNPLDPEQQLAKEKLKAQKFVHKKGLELIQDNPDLLGRMVAKEFGFEIPTIQEQKQSELMAHIDELLIELIDTNETLKNDVLMGRLGQLMESMGVVRQGEEWHRKPPTLDDWIIQVEKVEKLKEIIGIKPKGFFQGLITPEVLTALAQVIPALFGKNQGVTPGEPRVFVELDGDMVILPHDEFTKYLAEGRVKPVNTVKPGPDIEQEGQENSPEKDETSDSDNGENNKGGSESK